MKVLLIMTVGLLLSGCGKFERAVTGWTGSLSYKCSKHNVEYVQSDSGLAVSVDAQGKPVLCN